MEWWNKIKGWAIPVIIILLVLFIFTTFVGYFGMLSPARFLPAGNDYMQDSYYGGSRYYGDVDFAPEVTERIITKEGWMTNEVKRGTLPRAEQEVNTIITNTDSILLTQEHTERPGYAQNTYNIKVPAEKYDNALDQLKRIGEIESLREEAEDITGQYTNLNIELAAERERLSRLESLSANRPSLSDKLTLENAIFDQQRKIRYLEETLATQGQRVDYSTIHLTIKEKDSALARLSFVGLGDLVATFVGSLKALLYFIAAIIPWAVGIGLVIYLYTLIKKLVTRIKD